MCYLGQTDEKNVLQLWAAFMFNELFPRMNKQSGKPIIEINKWLVYKEIDKQVKIPFKNFNILTCVDFFFKIIFIGLS